MILRGLQTRDKQNNISSKVLAFISRPGAHLEQLLPCQAGGLEVMSHSAMHAFWGLGLSGE